MNGTNERRHSLDEQPYDDQIDLADGAAIHLASLAEKKRLWWRNAFINTIFIASWWVILFEHSI